MSKILYLVRHGQTTGDLEDRLGGDYDDHLTSQGRKQSEALAQQFKDIGADRLLCSPLIRARETAFLIGGVIGLSPRTVPGFKERNRYGILSGMVRSDAARRFPREMANVHNEWSHVEGAETYEVFKSRVLTAFDELIEELTETPTVLVTHGGVIRLLIKTFFGAECISVGDCSFIKIVIDAGTCRVDNTQGVTFRT